MPLARYRIGLSNWPGAPGVMTFYLGTSVADFTAIRTFCNAIKDAFPNGFTFQFPSSVDIINEANGQLTNSVAVAPQVAVSSISAANPYAGSAGALIRWSTSGFVNGKRVQGRTYCVPLAAAQFANDGSLAGATITLLGNAATALIAAYGDGIKVWARPKEGVRPGAFFTALNATVPDLAVVMRSRRI